jgi:hypothetical protein
VRPDDEDPVDMVGHDDIGACFDAGTETWSSYPFVVRQDTIVVEVHDAVADLPEKITSFLRTEGNKITPLPRIIIPLQPYRPAMMLLWIISPDYDHRACSMV